MIHVICITVNTNENNNILIWLLINWVMARRLLSVCVCGGGGTQVTDGYLLTTDKEVSNAKIKGRSACF